MPEFHTQLFSALFHRMFTGCRLPVAGYQRICRQLATCNWQPHRNCFVSMSSVLANCWSSCCKPSIFSTEYITVEWCLLLNNFPISGYERSVRCLHMYMATWRG